MSFPLVGLKLGHYPPIGTVKGKLGKCSVKNGVSPAHHPASLEVHLRGHLCHPPWPVHLSPPISTTTNSVSHPSSGPGLHRSWNQREAKKSIGLSARMPLFHSQLRFYHAVWPEASYSPSLGPGYSQECQSPTPALLACGRGRAGVRMKARDGWPPSSLAPRPEQEPKWTPEHTRRSPHTAPLTTHCSQVSLSPSLPTLPLCSSLPFCLRPRLTDWQGPVGYPFSSLPTVTLFLPP